MSPFVALYLGIKLNFGLQLIPYCIHVLESFSNLVIDSLDHYCHERNKI